MKRYESVDEYIGAAPEQARGLLTELRAAIREAAPEATERISYGMPAFGQNGILVYFGLFKDHIGFFPTASGVAAFAAELGGFATSKGTVRLPLDEPLPLPLIRRIVRFRVEENLAKRKR